jgi:hypothetical protein
VPGGTIVVPRPSQLHDSEELPEAHARLVKLTPASARLQVVTTRRRQRIRREMRRAALVALIVASTLGVGALLALAISTIR